MRAVWLVRSRQLAARFRFWLALFGYDPRDDSISHKIYLVYAAIFYLLWGFMVLTLLADGTAQLLAATGMASSSHAALSLAIAGLLAWTLLTAWKASRRSPIRFTEDDAYLICQTPASRRAVTLAWLAGQWPPVGVAAGALAVTLGFGVVEAGSPAGLTAADLPGYLLAGVRIVSVTLPLHLGLTSLVWALGVYRLTSARQMPRFYLLPLLLSVLLLVGLVSTSVPDQGIGFAVVELLAPLAHSPWTNFLSPLAFPLQAGFGLAPWGAGLLVAALGSLLCLGFLAWLAGDLNLSLAAMESRFTAAQLSNWRASYAQPAGQFKQPNRLGSGRQASRLPVREGWWALVWKDVLQTSRSSWLSQLGALLAIPLLSLGALTLNDWGVRAWLVLLWVFFVGQLATYRLRNDLALWSIFRQLPLPAGRLILVDAAIPLAITTLLSWLGLFVGVKLGGELLLAVILGLLIPSLAVNAALAAALDTLRLGNTASLLAADAPQPGLLGVLIGAVVIVLAGMLAWWMQAFGLILAIWLTLFTAALLLRASAGRLTRMK
jgi:hypothetical protein